MMAAEQTDGFWLSELVDDTSLVPTEADCQISDLCLDSREMTPGACFIARRGHEVDGNAFIDQAIDGGACAVVAEHDRLVDLEYRKDVPILRLPGIGERLSAMAAKFYGHPSRTMCVTGVTGTNGKTTVSWLLSQALAEHYELGPCGFAGTVGTGLPGSLKPSTNTTPDAISVQRLLAELKEEKIKSVVLEVSSHALVQDRVNAVEFDLAIFTNLTRDHLDYHHTVGAYRQAKKRLFEFSTLRSAVVNADDRLGQEIIAESALPHIFAYSLARPECIRDQVICVYPQDLVVDNDGIRMTINADEQLVQLRSQLLGKLNVENLLAAFAGLLALGVGPAIAAESLSLVGPAPGRLQRFGGREFTPEVIVDYAHTPEALRHVLLALRSICDGDLWCVFGCGGDRDSGKRALMGEIAEALTDHVILTNDNPRGEAPETIIEDILSGTQNRAVITVELERARAVARAVGAARPEDIVLVAGKGHETYQDIGGVRLPLSDQACVQNALARRRR